MDRGCSSCELQNLASDICMVQSPSGDMNGKKIVMCGHEFVGLCFLQKKKKNVNLPYFLDTRLASCTSI